MPIAGVSAGTNRGARYSSEIRRIGQEQFVNPGMLSLRQKRNCFAVNLFEHSLVADVRIRRVVTVNEYDRKFSARPLRPPELAVSASKSVSLLQFVEHLR
jgi:hypothetical protein